MFILALEASTASAKAMYYDTETERFELSTEPYCRDYEDISKHRPDNVYEQMTGLGRKLVHGRQVDIVALSGAWHSIGLFNKDITPATPMYPWTSTEPAKICAQLRKDPQFVQDYYRRTGCMVNATYGMFKLVMLSRDYCLRDYFIMGQGSYNNYRMTGKLITTDCHLSASGMLNIYSKTYDKKMLEILGIDKAQLSDICSYKDTYPLTKEAAKQLGIKAGVPVVLSCADGALNQTGSGALIEGIMTLSVGTSCAIRIAVNEPVLSPDCSTWCYLSPISWLAGAATNCGTSSVDWYKRCAFHEGTKYEDIERNIRYGESTPVFLPFIYGERCPGWNDERCGSFHNLLDWHNRYSMYHAVQEGVLFNVYQCYEALTRISGKPTHIRLSGGILHSEPWTQMCADIFGLDMEADENKQSSLMGAVVLAKERLGLLDDIRNYKSKTSKIIRCDKKKTAMYREKYEEYLRFYNAVN